jgi:FkbM family methyltransferase
MEVMGSARSQVKRLAVGAAARFGYRMIPETRLDRFEHARQLRRLFDLLAIDVILDVGANDGGFRELLRDDVGFTGRIASFEPVPDVYGKLAASAQHDPSWQGFQMALGDVDSDLDMNVCQRSTMSSFLTRDEARLATRGYQHLLKVTSVVRTQKVPVRRLDSVFDEAVGGNRQARVFLKCDTQGYDLQVIAGARESLSRIMALQIEISITPIYAGAPAYAEVIEQMTGMGFDVTGIYPVRRDELTRILNFDCVMINSRHPVVADLAARTVIGRTSVA